MFRCITIGIGLLVLGGGSVATSFAAMATSGPSSSDYSALTAERAPVNEDGIVFTGDIRNIGNDCVDVEDFSVSADRSGSLELVRGTFHLQPGDSALIITHPDVDPDDRVRAAYDNLYRQLSAEGTPVATLTRESLGLHNAAGRLVDNGGTTAFDLSVICCIDDEDGCICPVPKLTCCETLSPCA